jgi:uncharacterized membrane protein (TIGR01666 family)
MQSITETTKETKQFLLSQYFSDGIKITLGVLLPSLVLFQFGMIETGIAISLGALCVSVTDNPGPPAHKRNAMLAVTPLLFLMAIITGFSNFSPILIGIEITVFCFLFSMFNVYGARAAAVGTSALIIVILGIDKPMPPHEVWLYALHILIGGVWYMLLSLSINTIWPYRAAQQLLGESIRELAEYLTIKADFYDTDKPTEEIQKKLIKQQIDVHQHQENVREVLFKTRKLLKDASPESRRIILTFVDIVDLFEQAMATHYDYDVIRKQFADSKILNEFGLSIRLLADELQHIGRLLHNREKLKPLHLLEPRLNELKKQMDVLETSGQNVIVLKKILINIRNIGSRINRIYKYTESPKDIPASQGSDYSKFVTRQSFDPKIFWDNLTFKSGNFRHALRVSIVCLAVFIIAGRFYSGHYGYWILLTVIVILKPGFSLTKQRNYERVIGTVVGGLIGAGVLYFIHDKTILFVFLLIFMVLSYSFMRLRYVIGVLFMTPFILIMFSFTASEAAMGAIVQERIIDTLIGALVAGVASYLIFPSWESNQIRKLMADAILANAKYLAKAVDLNQEDRTAISDYRLARKEMYVTQANLTSAFQRMLDEPKHRQKNATSTHRFVILNHMLSSYIATLNEQLVQPNVLNEESLRSIRKSLVNLRDSYKSVLNQEIVWPEIKRKANVEAPNENILGPTLEMIMKTSVDIGNSVESDVKSTSTNH